MLTKDLYPYHDISPSPSRHGHPRSHLLAARKLRAGRGLPAAADGLALARQRLVLETEMPWVPMVLNNPGTPRDDG